VLVFILSITIFYRVVVQRGVGRSFMTKHSRREQLQSQFEYDPFAKDVDSYGVNVEDVDAPLAPEVYITVYARDRATKKDSKTSRQSAKRSNNERTETFLWSKKRDARRSEF